MLYQLPRRLPIRHFIGAPRIESPTLIQSDPRANFPCSFSGSSYLFNLPTTVTYLSVRFLLLAFLTNFPPLLFKSIPSLFGGRSKSPQFFVLLGSLRWDIHSYFFFSFFLLSFTPPLSIL